MGTQPASENHSFRNYLLQGFAGMVVAALITGLFLLINNGRIQVGTGINLVSPGQVSPNVIGLQVNQTLLTQSGITICTGDVSVNGDYLKGTDTSQDVGTLLVYRGSGGNISAPYGATCYNFANDPGSQQLDTFIASRIEEMKRSGCGGRCNHVNSYYLP